MSLCLGTIFSCTDGNDWGIDEASNRTMTPKITSVTGDSCALTVAFTNYGGTSYELEANVNPFPVDDIDGEIMDGSITSVVTASGGKIEGLNGYTDYYVRMRALTEDKKPSHWILFASKDTAQTATQTTGSQIIDPIDENKCSSNSIYVTWNADYTPDSITATYTNGKQKVTKTYVPTDADKASHSLTCTDLLPSTNYQIRAFTGTQCVGMREQKTLKAPPSADYTYYVEGDVIDQAMIEEIAAKAREAAGSSTNYAACIVIPVGEIVTVAEGTTNVSIPDGMTVYFYGNESTSGKKGTLMFPYNLLIPGYHSEISFENLNITSDGDTSSNKYVINQSSATSTGNVTFTSCNIYDFNCSVVRVQSGGGSIGTVTISDCVVSDQGSGSYPVIYNQATSGGIGEVVLEKSTFDGCVNGIVANNSKCDVYIQKVSISECTIYDCIASGKYIIDAGKNASSTVLATDVNISKTIIGKLHTTSSKGVQTKGTTTLDHVYMTSGNKFSGGSLKSTDDNKLDYRTGTLTDDALFEDGANHNFNLKRWFEQTSADESKGQRFDIYGDPRWRVETEVDDTEE